MIRIVFFEVVILMVLAYGLHGTYVDRDNEKSKIFVSFSKYSECNIDSANINQSLFYCGCGMIAKVGSLRYEFDVSQFTCYYIKEGKLCFTFPVSIYYNVDYDNAVDEWVCIGLDTPYACNIEINLRSIMWKRNHLRSHSIYSSLFHDVDSCFYSSEQIFECVKKSFYDYCFKGDYNYNSRCVINLSRYLYYLQVYNIFSKAVNSVDSNFNNIISRIYNLIDSESKKIFQLKWVELKHHTLFWLKRYKRDGCKVYMK